MAQNRLPIFRFLFSIFFSLLAISAAAQTLEQDLTKFAETPAVPGYEQALAAEIRSRLKNYSVQADNLGNIYLTLGSGSPHRLIVAPMDEPGYVVSGITADGYLRVQRLPQQAPHPLFDLLHAAQPVVIHKRDGKWVSGVVAGLSTHLQPNRQNAPRGAHPDEIYVDIGASSAAEVSQAGVELLDPVALDRKFYAMGFGKLTAPAIGDRFGCAALVELLRHIDPTKLHGTLTVAFVAQQWANSRGLDRLTQHVKADELIYVGRLFLRRASPAGRAEGAAESRVLSPPPGGGVLISPADREGELAGLGADFKRLAEENKIPFVLGFSAPLPRVSYTQGPVLPPRSVHLSVATAWPSTPGEVLDLADLQKLITLLQAYVEPGSLPRDEKGRGSGSGSSSSSRNNHAGWGPGGPAATVILEKLVETYGASGDEGPVRRVITGLLPPWAKPETDAAGNLVLRVGTAVKGPGASRLVIVAHMDEIGYQVRLIGENGRLVVRSLGGAIAEFFLGHAVLVHTAAGSRPGVLELPLGWDRADFQWPRAPQSGEAATWQVDVGARSAAEVEQLGIKAGDTITVPKKYRRLFGTRVNGRSFDDRVGCAALVAAVWALGPGLKDREVTFIWSTEEEVGLRGALAAAERLANEGMSPDYVFAVDTFVSSDSPLESPRFADAPIGRGFVVRAVDNSNITSRELVDRLVKLARGNHIPVQYGVTGGGNDGAAFLRYGSSNVPISWPLRYSHSPGEIIDTRDLEALAHIVAAVARAW